MHILSRIENLVLKLIPVGLALLVVRLGLAVPFWRSGIGKWDGFGQLGETAVLLFQEEFKLHIFGKAYDYPFPVAMAYASSVAEVLLPVLLVLGLFTRLAALALLAMTALIQITVPEGWPIHVTWAALALAVTILGPGRLSLDSMLLRGAR